MSVDASGLDGFADDLLDLVAEKIEESAREELDPMSPEEAVDKYFDVRDFDRSGTVNTQRSSLNYFIRWCEREGIDNMNDLTGRDLTNYRVWRRDEAPTRVDKLAPKTEETQQKITRKFIETCETFDACPEGLNHKVIIPSLDEEDEIRDDMLDSKRAKDILAHLRKFEYATVEHVIWHLFAVTGARISGIHSLDVDDYHSNGDESFLEFEHRPDEGTTLKNGEKGEREVSIRASTSELLDDYLATHRPDVEDEYGRRPLLASRHGRLSEGTIRKYCYKWTRPCIIEGDCPYGRALDECEATANDAAYKCPGSLSCHPVRKGYITQRLRDGVPKFALAERCNVAEDVIDKYYDKRTEEEKRQARKELLESVLGDEEDYGGA